MKWVQEITRGSSHPFTGWVAGGHEVYAGTIVTFNDRVYTWVLHCHGAPIATGAEFSLESAKTAVEQELKRFTAS